jgi:hypothetical protein
MKGVLKGRIRSIRPFSLKTGLRQCGAPARKVQGIPQAFVPFLALPCTVVVIRLQDGVFARYTAPCVESARCYSEESSLRGGEPPLSGKISSHENIPRSAIAGERRNIAAGATAMRIRIYIALMVGVFSSAAFAWQPLVYPVRSQSAYQRSVDTAMCYAAANKQTKVNIAHESQLPPRQPVATKTSSTGAPSRPPLPSSSFSATPPGASMPTAATAPAASGAGVSTAKATAAATTKSASSATATAATTTNTATTATPPASATVANDGNLETAATGAAPTAAASGVKLPPLPAPEPPMTQYWAAYGACMQARGYVVTQ